MIVKKLILLGVFVVLVQTLCAKGLYVKTGIKYLTPCTYQEAPRYFDAFLSIPSSLNGIDFIALDTRIKSFSIATGFNFGGTLGYNINEWLNIELGIDYFATHKTFSADSGSGVKIDWQFQTLNFTPAVLFGKKFKRSAFWAKAGVFVGIPSLKKYVLLNVFKEGVVSYEFSSNLSVGYTLGLEYNYDLNSKFSLVVELGINNQFYTPKRARLLENNISRVGYNYSGQTFYEYVKQIDYVKQLNNYTLTTSDSSPPYLYSNENEPSKRLEETLKLNSIFFGIGLKYNIGKHEKK